MIALELPPANDVRPKRLAAARRSPTAGNAGQGGNWIRKKRRHAIYARDGLACVWCGRTGLVVGSCAEDGATLDHFLAREHGGTNETSNLLTCCFACNSRRGSMSVLEFAGVIAAGSAGEGGDTGGDTKGNSARRFVVLERVFAALDRAT